MSDINITIKGTVKKIYDIETFASGFKKQTLVIEYGDRYPQLFAVEFVKDKIELLSAVTIGGEAVISCNPRGREYNGKYYITFVGWKIEASATTPDEIPY